MKAPMLHYEVHGIHGPYLLLVHGLLSSRTQWTPNLKELIGFCRPVVIELWGHGRSSSPENSESYTPDHYIREFERIREKLNIARWFVCGQSLGAALTLRYAIYHPEHFYAQIFTNSRSALSERSDGQGLKLIEQRIAAEGRKVIDNFPLHPSRSRHLAPDIKKALIRDVDLIDITGFKNTLLYTIPYSSVRDILSKIQVPTLMIVGRFDRAFAPLSEIAQQLIPGVQVQVFDGGHAVNLDAAEKFNETVKDFILEFYK